MPTKGAPLYFTSNPPSPSSLLRGLFEASPINKDKRVAQSNDPVEALQMLVQMVREGRARIMNFNISSNGNGRDEVRTINGTLIPIQREPPSIDFEIDAEIGAVGSQTLAMMPFDGDETDSRFEAPMVKTKGPPPRDPDRAGVVTFDGNTGEGIIPPRPKIATTFTAVEPGEANPWAEAWWNLTAQGQYVKKYGLQKAEAAARAAGVRLGATSPQVACLKIVRSGYMGPRENGTLRVPLNPTYTFEQRLVEKLSGQRIDHFEMEFNVYQMLLDMRLIPSESSPVMLRGFPCVIGPQPLPDDATLAKDVADAQDRSKAIINKCEQCWKDTRFLAAGDCKRRDCPSKLKTQPPKPPTQRRELIFDD